MTTTPPTTPPAANQNQNTDLVQVAELATYGTRNEVKELAVRIQYSTPGGRKLDMPEAWALAQISLAHALDATTGEIWYIPGSGPMIGIKGLRKCATRQCIEEGGTVYWLENNRIEPATVGEPETSRVYECILRDTRTTKAWAESVHALTTAGIPYAEAITYLGPAPCVRGLGIAKQNEASKMGMDARAKKRAEAEALKQRFNVDWAKFGDEDNVIDSTFTADDHRDAPSLADPNERKLTPEQERQYLADLGY